MSVQYATQWGKKQEESDELPEVLRCLEMYLQPLLLWQNAHLDRQLVRTCLETVGAILQFCVSTTYCSSTPGARHASGKRSDGSGLVQLCQLVSGNAKQVCIHLFVVLTK